MRPVIAILMSIAMLFDVMSAATYAMGATSDDGRHLTPICKDGRIVYVDLSAELGENGDPIEEFSVDCPMHLIAAAPELPASRAVSDAAFSHLIAPRAFVKTLAERPSFLTPSVRGPPASV